MVIELHARLLMGTAVDMRLLMVYVHGAHEAANDVLKESDVISDDFGC